MDKYQDEGVIDLGDPKVLHIAPFTQIGTPMQIVKEFGSKEDFEAAVHDGDTRVPHNASVALVCSLRS